MPILTDGVLYGSQGDDEFNAGGGDDKVTGDVWRLAGDVTGGDDELHGGTGMDLIYGDAFRGILGDAAGGNDLLYGAEDNDNLKGDAQVMRGDSQGGNDVIYGGEGHDRLQGDAWATYEHAAGGDDILYGGDDKDELYGDFLEYFGSGAGGNDQLYGGAGNDAISGGRGTDELYGGEGGDLFKLINYGDGVDTIHDFSLAQGDRIELEGFGINFGDLDTNGDNVVDGKDAHITVAEGKFTIDMTDYNTSPIAGDHMLVIDNLTALTRGDILILDF